MTDPGLIPRIEFNRLWADSNAQGNGNAVFFDLVQRYDGPRRHYHTLTHVMWVLKRIDEITAALGVTDDILELRWAAWFHDSVMTGLPLDERDSAFLAADVLDRAKLPRGFVDKVHRLINATGHDRGKLYEDESILSDADVAILGAPRDAFDEYEHLVRKEWEHVSDADFAKGRAAILRKFVNGTVYFTSYACERWEAAARENLRYSIAKLEAAE